MFKIEKNIAMPPKRTGTAGRLYPLAEMEVGDSFFVPRPDDLSIAKLQSRVTSGVGYARKHDKSLGKFSVRQVEGGVRVWRVE